MTALDGIPLFNGEAMLLSWGETSSRGKTVVFALDIDSAPDGHPFKGLGTGKYGQKFRLVAVPITSGGEPVSPGPVHAVHGVAAEGNPPLPSTVPGESKRERTLPEKVGMRCNDPAFIEWAQGQILARVPHLDVPGWVRNHCGVESRKEILPGTEAAKKWLALETRFLEDTGQMAERRR